ncbi:UNVERIFIED_CONTAM: hypothetical protein Cloal_3019 [Acetivibrio alkalicellulosi]
MLKLKENIEKKSFMAMLDICFKYSTYFSLTESPIKDYAQSEEYIKFLEGLSQFYIKTIETQHWFCYYVPKGHEKKVFLFKADKKAQTIIQSHFDNIYLRERKGNEFGNIKKTPEDLCFFIGNKLFVGTVSHEDICYAYPFSEAIKKEIMSLAEWNTIEFDYREQIVLNFNE